MFGCAGPGPLWEGEDGVVELVGGQASSRHISWRCWDDGEVLGGEVKALCPSYLEPNFFWSLGPPGPVQRNRKILRYQGTEEAGSARPG